MTRTAYRSTTSGLILSVLLAFAGIQPARAQTKDFNVTAQSATTGIPEFARQAGIQILVSEPLVRGKRIAAVTGLHSVDDALAILLKGTGLVATSKDGATYTVAAEAPAPISRNSTGAAGALAASPASAQDVPAGESSSTPSQTEKAKVFLEEVVVTGSRIPLTATEGSQDVKVYAREQIDQSGQTTVADFLNTLPDVSISTNENAFQTFEGSTTVQLHGLPLGTTLLLINGRRVQTSGGTFGTFFDLNNIPLVAVDRIEVVSEGSSAIYGSDAIAGVVNVILRKSFDGFEASGKYSFANGIPEWDSGLAWGAHWDKGSLSIVSSFQNRGELDGSGRAPTRNQDYRAFGGIDARSKNCNPGNVYTVDGSNLPGVGAPFAGVPAGFTGTPTQQELR